MKAALLAGAMALASFSANAADIRYNGTDKTSIVIEGMIVESDTAKLAAILKDTGINTLFLDSEGGYVGPALSMATLIDKRDLTTYVADGDSCLSSCFTLFAAGEKRLFHAAATIAVHSMSSQGTGDAVGSYVEDVSSLAATMIVAREYIDHHVPDGIVLKMIATPGGSDTAMTSLAYADLTVGGWAEGYNN